MTSLGHQIFPTVTTLLDPKLLDSEFGEFLRIALASLVNLDDLLCDKLRDRIASFNQVELTQGMLIGVGQHRYLFRPIGRVLIKRWMAIPRRLSVFLLQEPTDG